MLRSLHEHAPAVTARLRMASVFALAAVWLVAGLVLGFWIIASLVAVRPDGWAEMSALTAEGLLLAAGSLTLTTSGASRIAIWAANAAAAGVALIGISTFLDGFDVAPLAAATLPSPQTAAAFILLGVTLILMTMRRMPVVAAEAFAVVYAAFLLFMIGGYVFNAASMVEVSDGRLISPQTLACFLCLAFVVLTRLAIDGDGVLAMGVEKGLGSRILRAMTPAILVIPFVLFGLVSYFYETGILPANTTRAVFAPAVVIGIFGLVGWMAYRINRLEYDLTEQSITDELTGVLNRRGFGSVSGYFVKTAQRSGVDLVVLFFDLDGLKTLNDTLGHDAGSDLLKRFANLLTTTFRRSDVVARIGGDEFAVLTALEPDEIDGVIERLRRAVAELNVGKTAQVAFSVGFAPLKSELDKALEDAIAVADAFMYEQKRKNRKRAEDGRPGGNPQGASGSLTQIDWHI